MSFLSTLLLLQKRNTNKPTKQTKETISEFYQNVFAEYPILNSICTACGWLCFCFFNYCYKCFSRNKDYNYQNRETKT